MMSRDELLDLVQHEFPRWLQEDEEFRLRVLAALLPYFATKEDLKQILDRLDRTDAHRQQLEQQIAELRQDFRATQATMEAGFTELRADVQDLRQASQRQDASLTELRAEVQDLRQRMEAGFTELRRAVSRLGVVSEEVLRQTLQTAVEDWLQAGTVSRMVLGGREVDVVIQDGKPVILEITARAHLQDIEKLDRSADDYEQPFGLRPHLAIACAYASAAVVRRFVEAGIDIISADLPE
jgi:hypothetical protein